jgi:hypothetical protein
MVRSAGRTACRISASGVVAPYDGQETHLFQDGVEHREAARRPPARRQHPTVASVLRAWSLWLATRGDRLLRRELNLVFLPVLADPDRW